MDITVGQFKEIVKTMVQRKLANKQIEFAGKGEQTIPKKFPTVEETLIKLMTDQYPVFVEDIWWVAPRPTTFRIKLKNGESFFMAKNDLDWTIQQVKRVLNPSGKFFIAVPNNDAFDANYYGKFWAAYDVPRHLYHFSQKSMTAFQEEFGLELVRIDPLVYDSYYVSLLSEGYKNPKAGLLTRYFKAFKQGYRSNQRAGKPGNYSSNIFIFKKK